MKITSLITKDDSARNLLIGVMYSPLIVVFLVATSLTITS